MQDIFLEFVRSNEQVRQRGLKGETVKLSARKPHRKWGGIKCEHRLSLWADNPQATHFVSIMNCSVTCFALCHHPKMSRTNSTQPQFSLATLLPFTIGRFAGFIVSWRLPSPSLHRSVKFPLASCVNSNSE